VRLQKRLIERTNQPHAYIMQDVERAERELAFAKNKVKTLEEELKKAKKEIETLAIVSLRIIYILLAYSKRGA